jgi:hypothetical protein
MAGNVVDFKDFMEQKLDREAQVDLRADREALLTFIQQSDTNVYFAKWSLISFAEHVCDTPELYSEKWINLAKDILR